MHFQTVCTYLYVALKAPSSISAYKHLWDAISEEYDDQIKPIPNR